ncbi:MBL fold hydrolase [Halobacteriales archaeon QS_4_69_34]|nr:MAG: MBL fold hydrolase [Halobacteriales archaeon QS_4_69_34]
MDRIARVPVTSETAAPEGATNAHVVGTGDALLVDPAARTGELDRAVARRGVAGVLVTHTHPDHVGAVAEYAAEYGLTVWARRGRERRFERRTGVAPDRTVGERTHVETDDGVVVVRDTPGHAPDHVALEVSDERGDGDGGDSAVERPGSVAVLCGDLAVATGSVVIGAPEGDVRAYLTALRRLHARDPDRLYPGHGPVIDEPRAVLERLLAHRLRRERRALAAVEAGARSVPAVTDAAYGKDVSGVRGLAERTVEAHIEKLAVENRVTWDGERVAPTGRGGTRQGRNGRR